MGMGTKKTVVAVSGAFDPIHVGHVRYLKAAAKLGDKLVVILNSDDFLLKKKGFIFTPFTERKEILESIKGVDEVVASVDEDQTVCKTLGLVKPDIFAKGGDRTIANIPETETCRMIGCKVMVNVGGGKFHAKADVDWTISDLGIDGEGKLRIQCPYCDDHPILRERCRYCKGAGKVEVGK
jgi:D-beta-D-heptose 7-phosphate kinase/D-beta-D-heptose 1-phosphate adenosyltransferase